MFTIDLIRKQNQVLRKLANMNINKTFRRLIKVYNILITIVIAEMLLNSSFNHLVPQMF